MPGFVGRRIGVLELAGKREHVEAWEALPDDAAEQPWLDAYHEAYDQMASGAAAALESLESLERERPDDALVRFHRRRLAAGERGVLVRPSGSGQSGSRADGALATESPPRL